MAGSPSSMLSGGIEETSDVKAMKRPPLLDTSLLFCSTSMSTGGREETLEPSEYEVSGFGAASSRGLLPREMRRVYEGFLVFLLVWVICTWSLVALFLREDGVTRTRTLGRDRTLLSDFPPSKYSISSEVCEGYFLCRLPLALVVLMVTGVPSSGMLYDVLSVREETLVSTSSGRLVSLSTELSV